MSVLKAEKNFQETWQLISHTQRHTPYQHTQHTTSTHVSITTHRACSKPSTNPHIPTAARAPSNTIPYSVTLTYALALIPINSACNILLFRLDQLTSEAYCEKCWGMRSTNTLSVWEDHLLRLPHNHACPCPSCPRIFVEAAHLAHHLTICEASRVMQQERKERENQGRGLINFARAPSASPCVWIACYPSDAPIIAPALNGPDRDQHSFFQPPQCDDPCYRDPKHFPPVADSFFAADAVSDVEVCVSISMCRACKYKQLHAIMS